MVNEAAVRKRKGKSKEGESDIEMTDIKSSAVINRLSTLDIFAGCGGLSEGLQKAGIYFLLHKISKAHLICVFIKLIVNLLCTLTGASVTKWAIEYEEPAGDAFRLNHPDALAFVHNCNVILRF